MSVQGIADEPSPRTFLSRAAELRRVSDVSSSGAR